MSSCKEMIGKLFVIFALFASSICVCANLYEESDRFISGAEKISLSSSPIFYNTYLPLIYEFNLPSYDTHSMKIQYWKFHNNCTESDLLQDGYPCPIMYHMNDIVESLVKNYTIWENLFPNVSKTFSVKIVNETDIKLPSDNGILCNEIVSHFKHFQSTTTSLENYLSALRNCPLGEISIEMEKDKFVYKLEELYHGAFTAFPEAYYSISPDPANKGMTLNSWTALQTGLLMNHYIESNRWTNALSSCQAKLIPYSLIDLPSFEKVIRNSVLPKINKKGYKLAVSLDELSSYFKLPLADCVFASKKFLFVRILIPLLKVERSYSISTFKSIPFWKRTGDNKNQGELCSLRGIDNKVYIHDKNSQFIQETSCKANELCQVAESTNIPYSNIVTNPCISALNKDSKRDILGKCPLTCTTFSTDDENFPIIIPSPPNRFFIAGKSRVEKIRIECPNKTTQVIPNLEFGAWNLSLPCNCQIIKDTQVFRADDRSCKNQTENGPESQLSIFPVKPYHWEAMTDEQLSNSRETSYSFTSNGGSRSGALSSADFSRFQLQQDDKAEAFPIVSMADVNELIHEKYSTILAQQIFLWVVILFLVIVMAVLSFFVYHLKQWKQNELNRRNRLVYNVGDATDMTEHF